MLGLNRGCPSNRLGSDPQPPAPQWYLAWLGILTHGCLVGCGQLRGIVVHIQDSDPQGCPGELGVIVCNKSTSSKRLQV